jgi:hypothetical protein
MPEVDDAQKKHDRDIDALIAAGLVALKRAFGITLILRLLQLTFRQVTIDVDRKRVVAILQSELTERTSVNGSIYRAVLEFIEKAGPDVVDYEINQLDDFGLVLSTRLERAQRDFVRQVNNALTDAVIKEEFRTSVSVTIFNILSNHAPFKRLMAYDTARAYNLQLLSDIFRSNADRLRIRVSDEHVVTDICDHLIGIFPVSEFTGPPYRRLPPFHPFCNCYVVPYK